MTDCDPSFDLEITKRVEVDDETLPYAEEGDTEIDEGAEPDFPFTRRQCKRGRNKKKYNPYGEDFVVDRIVLRDVVTGF